ncbi:MAG: 3'-5' exonuclease, partial [Pseudomonadota bacterium]
LVDEAQDTSPGQWTIVNTLTDEFFSGQSAQPDEQSRTLFVVGDEKQSIYAFQGADPEMFLSERRQFISRTEVAEIAGATPNMEMSFRSSPDILSFVDTVFDTNALDGDAPFSIEPPGEADQLHHAARRANQPGCVELWPVSPPDEAADPDPWAPVDKLPITSPKARLAKQVADCIQSMIERRDAVWFEHEDRSWSRRAVEAGDVLVLVQNRTGGLFDRLIAELKARNLPVAGADRLVLTDHIAVQDCLNLIRFALFPADDLTLAEILRGPFCGLVDDDRHLFPLAHGREPGCTLWDRVRTSNDPAVEPARSFLETLLNQTHLPAFEFLSATLEQPGPDGETGWRKLLGRLGAPARDPLEALLSLALDHDGSGPTSLQMFLTKTEAEASEIKRDLAESAGAIRIMTVHGAKGLQAPVVILPDTTRPPKSGDRQIYWIEGAPIWAPGGGPHPAAVEQAQRLEADRALREHRRLLYVALTRAQDRLLIFGAWRGGVKSEPGYDRKSWYALCRTAAEKLGEPEHEHGYLRLGAPPLSAPLASDAGASSTTAPHWLARRAKDEQSGARFVSPTGLAKGTPSPGASLAPNRAAAMKRGQIIHALLQFLPDLAQDRRREAALRFLQSDRSLSEAQRSDIFYAVQNVLADAAFAEVFSSESRGEVAVVASPGAALEGMTISGRVDRLVVTPSEVLIVDFKTDRPAAKTADETPADYLRQMAAYRAALRDTYPDRRVSCALLWTDGPHLTSLPDSLLDQFF